MKVFEITDYEHDIIAEHFLEDGFKVTEYSIITYSLQFAALLMMYSVFIEKDGGLRDHSDFSYSGDGKDWNLRFDDKEDYEDFRKAILEKSEEIMGRKLKWRQFWEREGGDTVEVSPDTPPPKGKGKGKVAA